MPASEISNPLTLNRQVWLLTALCLGCLVSTLVDAGAIRKIVDEKGVSYFTNQPPEDNPLQRPGPVAPATPPAPAASAPAPAASAPAPAVSASVPRAANAPAPAPAQPSSAPVKAAPPDNPTKALGDWPPRSLVPTPPPSK